MLRNIKGCVKMATKNLINENILAGFSNIPGYSRYVINKNGILANVINGEYLAGNVNPDDSKVFSDNCRYG